MVVGGGVEGPGREVVKLFSAVRTRCWQGAAAVERHSSHSHRTFRPDKLIKTENRSARPNAITRRRLFGRPSAGRARIKHV